MNIGKLLIFAGPVMGIATLAMGLFLPNYYQPGVGFFGFVAGLFPVVGYIIMRRVVPTAFTYADAKMAGKRVLWVFSEDKRVMPVLADFDSGKLLVGDTPVLIDSPEDIYILDGVPTAIMYRPVGKTLDPKKLLYIRELERLGFDKKSFTRKMQEAAFRRAFMERFEELVRAGYSKEEAEKEALNYAKAEMTNPNKMPQELRIRIGPDGSREVVQEEVTGNGGVGAEGKG